MGNQVQHNLNLEMKKTRLNKFMSYTGIRINMNTFQIVSPKGRLKGTELASGSKRLVKFATFTDLRDLSQASPQKDHDHI